MTERVPWFTCYPDRLLGALASMQPSVGYTYVVMLLRIYECGGACPDSLDAITKRVGHNKRIVSDALDNLFKAGRLHRAAEGIRNPVADRVLAEQKEFLERRKRSGQRGAFARWKKPEQKQQKANGKTNANAMRDDGYLPLQVPEQEDKKVSTPISSARAAIATRADRERELFRRGKEVLGRNAGGLITRLLKSLAFDVDGVARVVEDASQKFDPREYFAGAIQAAERRTKRETIADVWDSLDGLQGRLESDADNQGGAADNRLLPPR
jgi:hypothetical protein